MVAESTPVSDAKSQSVVCKLVLHLRQCFEDSPAVDIYDSIALSSLNVPDSVFTFTYTVTQTDGGHTFRKKLLQPGNCFTLTLIE